MAMIKCKECKSEISDKAKVCPHCGAPVPKKTSFATWLFLFLFIVTIIFFIIPTNNHGVQKVTVKKSNVENAIKSSDDYSKYKKSFVIASTKLINSGTCSIKDFIDMGGWVKSNNYKNKSPVYFTYCGGMKISNRIYLDITTGKTFK